MHKRCGIEQLDALTAGRQLLGEGARDDAVVYVLPHGKERYGPVRRFVPAEPSGCPQAVHKLRYDRQHRQRMSPDQPFKGGFLESQQYGVAKRRNGRRTPSPSKQPHLADCVTSLAARYTHHRRAANGDTEASRDDNIERVRNDPVKKICAAGTSTARVRIRRW
jgi:hypothetical protein